MKVRIEGIRGKGLSKAMEKGKVEIVSDEGIIFADVFEGFGNEYKKRETPEIIIQDDYRETVFIGTMSELIEKLK